MKNSIEYLDLVKEKLGVESDYALAKKLELTKSAISTIRMQKGFIGEDTAIKIALILRIDPIEILAATAAERTKNAMAKTVWRDLSERLSVSTAALVLVSSILQVAPNQAEARAITGPYPLNQASEPFILC